MKKRHLFTIFFFAIFSFLLPSVASKVSQAQSTTAVKNYSIWWPVHSTNWAYRQQLGGVAFMDYNHQNDFSLLKRDFEAMIRKHKPNLLLILADWRDLQPLKWSKPSGGSLPENNVALDQVVDQELSFDYFDDLVYLSQVNSIEVIFYPNVSGYGGQVAYPFSYYSKTGWFWKRPNFAAGIADPTTDAMRHPGADQNESNYDWCEHTAAYENVDCNTHHWGLTNNGVEYVGMNTNWPVYESADMVFNGYDLGLHSNDLHLHSPVPSFSSEAYRQVTRELFKKIAAHFRNKGLSGYFLFQEPTYAHLRENIRYSSGYTGTTENPAGRGDRYEVDYSQAERGRYNLWRQNRGLPALSRVPFPPDSTYKEFREDNLADFLNNLKAGLKEGDPNAQTTLSIFLDPNFEGLAVNPQKLLRTINPEIIAFEPPHTNTEYFEDRLKLQNFVNLLRSNSSSQKFISYYSRERALKDGLTLGTQVDQNTANIFGSVNFTDFFAPAFKDGHDPEGYATWGPSDCANCSFRYQVPGTPVTLTTVSGRVSDTLGNPLANVTINKGVTSPFQYGRECNVGTATTDVSGNFRFDHVPAGPGFCLRSPTLTAYQGPTRSYECQVAGRHAVPDSCGRSPGEDQPVDNQYHFTYDLIIPRGDLNHDGQVNEEDLRILVSKLKTNDAEADLNHDSVINGMDFGEVRKISGR